MQVLFGNSEFVHDKLAKKISVDVVRHHLKTLVLMLSLDSPRGSEIWISILESSAEIAVNYKKTLTFQQSKQTWWIVVGCTIDCNKRLNPCFVVNLKTFI